MNLWRRPTDVFDNQPRISIFASRLPRVLLLHELQSVLGVQAEGIYIASSSQRAIVIIGRDGPPRLHVTVANGNKVLDYRSKK